MSTTATVEPVEPDQPDRLLDRIDHIAALLEVALAPELEAGRRLLRKDPIDAKIFDLTAGTWVLTGELQTGVTKATTAKGRTIRNRLAVLVERGLLRKRGGGRGTEFRSAGVV